MRKRFVNRNFPVKRHEPQKIISVKKFHALLIVAVKEVSQFNNTSQLTLNILCARRASWVLGRKSLLCQKGYSREPCYKGANLGYLSDVINLLR